MINPDELVDAVVASLQSIAPVVILAGATSAITAYQDTENSMLRAISAMPKPCVLVCWRGMEPAGANATIQWRQQISIYVRAASDQRFGDYMDAILNGIPPSSTRAPFSNPDDIDSRFEMLGVPLCSRVTDENNVDYLEIQLVFGQKTE